MGLKSIAEMLVLSVGEIGRLQLVELGFGDVASIQLVSSSVLSDVDKPDEHGDADSQAEEDDNADFGRSVGRGVFSSERLGSQEVAEAVSDQQNGVDTDFLGMAGGVGGDQRQHANETNGIQHDEIEATESGSLAVWKESEQARSHQGNGLSDGGDQTSSLCSLDNPSQEDTANKLDSSLGSLHEQCSGGS